VVSFSPRPPNPLERAHGANWICGWVAPRASLEVAKKKHLTLLGIEIIPWIIHRVASRYADGAILRFIYLRAFEKCVRIESFRHSYVSHIGNYFP
jgi:hypothetical protein